MSRRRSRSASRNRARSDLCLPRPRRLEFHPPALARREPCHTFLLRSASPLRRPRKVRLRRDHRARLGLQRMGKRNALIRRLASVETPARSRVICTDTKREALTRNEMTCDRKLRPRPSTTASLAVATHPKANLCAANSDPYHDIPAALALEDRALVQQCAVSRPLTKMRNAGALSAIRRKARSSSRPQSRIGARTRRSHRVHEIPFDSTRKLMSVVVSAGPPKRHLHQGRARDSCSSVAPLSNVRRYRSLSAARRPNSCRKAGRWPLAPACPRGSPAQEVDRNFRSHSEHNLIFVALVGSD
jgi:Ca2+-transporting ATPase